MPKVVPEYKEEAKDRIIKAAFKVFTEKGYHQATMDNVAKEIGVSKAALYQYYKNKRDMLNEIVLSYHSMFREVLKASFEKQESTAIQEEGSQALLQKYRLHHEMFFELIAIAAHDQEILHTLKAEYEKDIKLLEDYFRAQMERGKLSTKIEANTLAQFYFALYVGMAMKVIIGDDSVEIHRVWSNAIANMMAAKK